MSHRMLLAALAALAVACGVDAEPVDAPDLGPAPDPFQVTWGPLEVAPGVEDVRCVTLALGNEAPLAVHEIHNVLAATSHHFIVYKAAPDAELHDDPRRCESVENLIDPSGGAPLMVTQKTEERLVLPPGVAFELAANQRVRLELHYINASETVAEVSATATFTPIAPTEFETAADFLFVGSPDIDLPPMQASTLGPVYTPMPAELLGAKVFGLTGHEHQWGTNVRVEVAESFEGPFTPVYDVDNFNWDEPETVFHDPPFEIPRGGGFRFTCDWFNQSPRRVGFGEGVDDEMCFFWAYYYPSVGARTCFHTEQFGSFDVCCPSERDAEICALILDLL